MAPARPPAPGPKRPPVEAQRSAPERGPQAAPQSRPQAALQSGKRAAPAAPKQPLKPAVPAARSAAQATTLWDNAKLQAALQQSWTNCCGFLRTRRGRYSLLGGLLALFTLLFFFLPAFHLTSFQSTPIFFVSEEDVYAASGLRPGQHFLSSYGGSLDAILSGRYAQAEAAVQAAFPGLHKVRIHYQFPGQVLFSYEERIPVAFMDVADSYITLDRYGVVLASYAEAPQGIPVIRGIEAVQMKVGETVKTNADNALQDCVAVMSGIVEADFASQSDEPLLPRIAEIRSQGLERILITLYPGEQGEKLEVSCSSGDDLKNNFLWLKKVLASRALQDKLPGTLDIYGDQLVFRPARTPENDSGSFIWQDEIGGGDWIPEEELPQEGTGEDIIDE